MTLNQLIYFQTIARLEHFRRASEELSVSQPSLSHSMSQLEEELGIKLFKRNGRNVTLTKYGKIFLERVNTILDEIKSTEKYMKQLSGSKGHIDIAYVYPLSFSYIPKLVRSFLDLEENKDTTFTFSQLLTKDIISGIEKDTFDVGFCGKIENKPEINFIPILRQEMVIITSLSHPLVKKDSVRISEIEKYPIIGYDKVSALGNYTSKIFKENRLRPNIVYFSPDENAIASLVAEDFGIAMVANIESLVNYRVKVIKISDREIYHDVYLAYKNDNYQLRAVKDFIKFVNTEFKN